MVAIDIQKKTLEVIEDYVRENLEEDVKLPLYQAEHLELAPGSFSTATEGLTGDGEWLADAISNAIMEERLVLPEGILHDRHSIVELMFYSDN